MALLTVASLGLAACDDAYGNTVQVQVCHNGPTQADGTSTKTCTQGP